MLPVSSIRATVLRTTSVAFGLYFSCYVIIIINSPLRPGADWGAIPPPSRNAVSTVTEVTELPGHKQEHTCYNGGPGRRAFRGPGMAISFGAW
jgi:hypothetical protein